LSDWNKHLEAHEKFTNLGKRAVGKRLLTHATRAPLAAAIWGRKGAGELKGIQGFVNAFPTILEQAKKYVRTAKEKK
jgi:hypothetical protein